MKKVLPRYSTALLLSFGIFLLFLLLRNADIAMDGVRRGLSLCTEMLLPSLFPFMVLSELLVAMRAGEVLGRPFSRPIWVLFGISNAGATAYLLGALCGFPVGMTTAVSLRRRGVLRSEELERMALFANTPSSGFLIGAVGEALFGNRGAGIALFVMTLTSAALIGIFLRIVCGPPVPHFEKRKVNTAENGLVARDFTDAIKHAFFSFLQVMAFVLFFSCVAGCLAPLLALLQLPAFIGVFLYGTLEMTSGISAAVTAFPAAVAFRVCAFFAGFSGLSVCLQLFAVAEGEGLRFSPYLLSKTVQGALNLLFAEIYLRVFRPSFNTATGVFAQNAPRLVFRAFLPTLWVLIPIGVVVAVSLFWQHLTEKKKKEH